MLVSQSAQSGTHDSQLQLNAVYTPVYQLYPCFTCSTGQRNIPQSHEAHLNNSEFSLIGETLGQLSGTCSHLRHPGNIDAHSKFNESQHHYIGTYPHC
ncbi:hypothetical protein FGO68_gene6927 [Halteria grandinella]|uniref:Uncharacterized protein n=1 Tax=Halteria grandinella TaxID=5974 RepID=A0A8J8P6Y4_HALGN|nr:hypothetical protein FGO68_gene6927 [Halteria grandinella]